MSRLRYVSCDLFFHACRMLNSPTSCSPLPLPFRIPCAPHNFQFYDPEPTDFWSIEHFLRDYVDDHKDFPAQAMAQAISNQAVVGTTIKTGAGEYPIGFMSVLNVHTYRVCCRLPAAG
jgi:hypothetical protein